MLIPVILGSSFIVFFILSLAPGNAVTNLAGDADPEAVAELEEKLGLNDPLIVQYGRYLFRLVQGDLGESYYSHKPVIEEYMARFPNTLKLAACSILVAIIIAIPAGVYSAVHQYSFGDYVATSFALVGISLPNFFQGLLLIIIFALWLGWLPSGGADFAKSLILPAITCGTHMAATVTRMTRSSMLEVIRQDYIQMARAKGVNERKVIYKHALRNALIPVITTIGLAFGTAIGGTVAAETVFSWPGVGRLMVESINRRDTNLVLGSIIMTTVIISVVNLIVDIAYAYADPRIRAQYIRRGARK